MFVGPDKTGKTNIARAVSETLKIPYFKASSERSTFCDDRSQFIEQLRHADMRAFDLIKQTGVSVVMDRAYPCEYAYSAVTGRPTDLEMLRAEDDAYASIGAVIVLCYRTSYAGLRDDLDESIDAAKLWELTRAYFTFAEKFTKCRVLKLCVDSEDLQSQVSQVITFVG